MNKLQRVELDIYAKQLGVDKKTQEECELVVNKLIRKSITFGALIGVISLLLSELIIWFVWYDL